VVLPLQLRHEAGPLSFFSIAAIVETAADVTVDELVIESFYPADQDTTNRMNAFHRAHRRVSTIDDSTGQ
jgi:hypothetical protein